ncbi:MAG: hypothetical protein JNM29_08610 [Candidatus Odyssella sp.]|nr:hypothetical protein [Candidatus Odyssella sp.]
MRAGALASAILALSIVAGCAAPQQPPSARETERPRDALPDAYKHPPK